MLPVSQRKTTLWNPHFETAGSQKKEKLQVRLGERESFLCCKIASILCIMHALLKTCTLHATLTPNAFCTQCVNSILGVNTKHICKAQ